MRGQVSRRRPRPRRTARGDHLDLAGRLGQRDADDLGTAQRHHHAERAVADRADRVHAEPGGQNPVERGRRAAALDVAEHRAARLLAGPLLDLLGQQLADTAQPDVAERVEPLAADLASAVGRVRALRDHHDRRVPGLEPVLHVGADLLDAVRLLRDQDDVCAARQAGVQRDPAGAAPHHLDDQRAVVALGRGVQPVDGLHRDIHRGVEAERVVGRAEVVVDGLGHADHADALVVEPGRHAEGVLAADHHQCVHAQAGQVVLDPVNPGPPAAGLLGAQRIGPRRAEDGAAAGQDPADRLDVQRDGVPLQRPAPAVPEPDELESVLRYPLADHGADHRVQAGAVSAAGEHSHSHGARVEHTGGP